MAPKRQIIDKAAVHENAAGTNDDTIDITLDDGSTVTDTPFNLIKRVQAGEFMLKPDDAEAVADLHNGAVLDVTKDTGNAELVEPEALMKVSAGNGEAPPAAPETPAITNTDTGLGGAAPQIGEAPGASTQTDSATTVSSSSLITPDNPVVQESAGTVRSAPTSTDVTAIAPPPEANAGGSGPAANPTPVENQINPRAQAGAENETTGEQAAAQAAQTEQSTWTPAAALNPQEPTTLAEHASAVALEAAKDAPGAGTIEERMTKLEARMQALEAHQDEIDRDLTLAEEKLSKL